MVMGLDSSYNTTSSSHLSDVKQPASNVALGFPKLEELNLELPNPVDVIKNLGAKYILNTLGKYGIDPNMTAGQVKAQLESLSGEQLKELGNSLGINTGSLEAGLIGWFIIIWVVALWKAFTDYADRKI